MSEQQTGDCASTPVATGRSDDVLYIVTVGLIVFGVVMVYSASFAHAVIKYHDGQHFVVRQAIFALLALGLLTVLERVDYQHLRRHAGRLLLVSLGLLMLLVVGLGDARGGAERWLVVGPISIQPAELAKLALIVWLARSLASKEGRMQDFSIGFLPHVLIATILAAMCLTQPDFGSAAMLMVITYLLLYLASASLLQLLMSALVTACAGGLFIALSPYAQRRLASWKSDEDPQVKLARLGFSSDSLLGVGLGESQLKLLRLPEAHTDFVLAIVAEELGLLGFYGLQAAYACLVYRGVVASLRAPDLFGRYLGLALTLFVAIEALTNAAVVLGIVPNKGLASPFLSYGGSSLIVNAAAAGILLNISRPRRMDST